MYYSIKLFILIMCVIGYFLLSKKKDATMLTLYSISQLFSFLCYWFFVTFTFTVIIINDNGVLR